MPLLRCLRLLGLVAGLPWLGLLQGCATYSLWGYDYPGATRPEAADARLVRLAEQTTAARGDLAVLGDHETRIWSLATTSPAAHWWLRPEAEADVADRLLLEREWVTVDDVEVAATREFIDDEIVRSTAEVRLRCRFDLAAVGAAADPATLRPEAMAVLAEPRWNSFVYAADPTLFLPAVLRSCVQRVPAVQLGRLGDGGAVSAVSFVFTDAAGSPVYEAGMPTPEGADRADLPLAERLALLAGAVLLVRVEAGGTATILRLRPDRFWLWSACAEGPAGSQHSSRWRCESVAAAPDLPSSRTVPSGLTLTEGRSRRSAAAAPSSPLWMRVLCTPFTVALDCTLLLPFNALVAAVHDEDDEPLPGTSGGRR
jgi:hypothetical protein